MLMLILGPKIQKYLWWKKYITILQLGQFVVGFFYGILLIMFNENYPLVLLALGFTQPPFFFHLFYDFYKKAYNNKQMNKCNNNTCNNNNNNNNNVHSNILTSEKVK